MSALRRGSLTRRVITEREQLQEGFLQARRMEAVGRLGEERTTTATTRGPRS